MHRLIMLSKTYQLASDFGFPPLGKQEPGRVVLPLANGEPEVIPPLSKGGPGGVGTENAQASVGNPAGADPRAVDPGNRWYWRYDRRRLDAESIRDAMLAVSGNLDPSRPGPHPFPPIDSWAWTQHKPFKAVYPSDHRSIYLMTQRIQRHPYLALFDGPDPNYSTEVRTQATVPLQALYMMNNPFVEDQAKGLAQRLVAASTDARRRIEWAHEHAWGRPPQPIEYDQAIAYVDRYTEELTRAGATPDQIELEAWTSYARIVLTANEFVYVD
jgi:hypothetical protein